MYFASAVIVLAGLSSMAAAYDDGMYHPDQVHPTTTTTSSTTTAKGTTYVSISSSVTPEIYKTSEYSQVSTTAYAPPSQSTYVGYWSQNATVTYKSSNTTAPAKPGNFSKTATTADRIYTTTVCDFQSSCYTTVATATGAVGQGAATATVQPTMMPFSSSERLVAGGWAALALCGVAMLL